jgi:hypothetical protein
MLHGRVSSGDTSVEKAKEDAERALNMASEFLRHWIDVFSRSKRLFRHSMCFLSSKLPNRSHTQS